MRLDNRARACAAVAMIGMVSLGGGCGSETESEQAAEVLDEIGVAIASGDEDSVCDGLTRQAQLQVREIGHGVERHCSTAMRPLLGALSRQRRAGVGSARPTVKGIDVRMSAMATVAVDGRTIRVPMVKEGGVWKLDSFFGVTPRPSATIQ